MYANIGDMHRYFDKLAAISSCINNKTIAVIAKCSKEMFLVDLIFKTAEFRYQLGANGHAIGAISQMLLRLDL